MKAVGLSLVVGLIMAVAWFPGAAHAGKNLKTAEYYVDLAEKYSAEGRDTVLAPTVKSAEDSLSKATAEEQVDPKYGELKNRLATIKSKGAKATEPTGKLEDKDDVGGVSAVALNPKIVRWATKALENAEKMMGGKASLSKDEGANVCQSLEQAQGELDKATDAERQTAEYEALKQRYERAQAKCDAVLAAAEATATTAKGAAEAKREAEGAAGAAADADADADASEKGGEAKLVLEIQDLEQAYKQAIAVVSGLSYCRRRFH